MKKRKQNQQVVLDGNELYKNAMNSINGQIASINRDWQSQVWKAHNDKQKRIEMLRRNGGSGGVHKSQGGDNLGKKKKSKNKNKNKNKFKNRNEDKSKSESFVGFVPHDHMKEEYKMMNQKKNRVKNDDGGKQNVNENKNKNNKMDYNQNGLSNRRRKRRESKSKKGNHDNVWNNDSNKHKANNENTKKASNGTIKFEWVDKLMDMGFPYEKVDALSNTNSVGYNEALDYLMQNV